MVLKWSWMGCRRRLEAKILTKLVQDEMGLGFIASVLLQKSPQCLPNGSQNRSKIDQKSNTDFKRFRMRFLLIFEAFWKSPMGPETWGDPASPDWGRYS